MKTPTVGLQVFKAQLKEALYLRYGEEEPSKDKKLPALLSIPTVAKLMKITPSKANSLFAHYFRQPYIS